MRMHSFPLAALALAAALSGCASLSTPSAPSTPASTATVAPYKDALELAGKLSVTYTRDGKQEASYVRFLWQQSAQRTDITITAPPLNQTVATIAVTPGEATLTESGKPPRRAADIDTLSAQALGWTLPVSGLRDWLQGYATAANGQRYAASPAASQVATADGWRVSYVSWQDGPPGTPPRPKRIDAERGATGQVDDMTIRIVIDATE
jgi:outer membrane lipoprotein LolB